MISLKKYLDMEQLGPGAPDPSELFQVTLESYRAALQSMGENAARACPVVGSDLQCLLMTLADRLISDATAALLAETGSQASAHLQQWGDRSAEYSKARTAEIKELLIVLARTAESVGERDHQYADQLSQFTNQLQTISNLEDLAQVRASLVQQAAALKTYVDHMEEDSHKLVENLQTQVSTYETRIKEVEEVALRDVLTGLANRRRVESEIELRIARGQAFCVVMLDINRLKQVNDKHGHLAGDNLLLQFAQELRSNSRSSDIVGRWGGDEFLVVMDGDMTAANAQTERVQKWVFGSYTIRPGKGSAEVKVRMEAAVGSAQWQPGETGEALIERADAEMYKQKRRTARKAAAAGAD